MKQILFLMLFCIQVQVYSQTLDNTFNSTGIVTNSLGSGTDYEAQAVKQQTDGKLVVVVNDNILGLTPTFKVTRYNTNGSLDNTFGIAGVASANINGFTAQTTDLIIQPDGKILVSGYYNDGIYDNGLLMRYNTNGTLDNTFGVAGLIILQAVFSANQQFNKLALQADGKIVTGGWTDNGIFNLRHNLITRHKTNGQLDSSFAVNGIFINIPNNAQNEVLDLKIQPDGKIVFCGYTQNVQFMFDFQATLSRITTTGVLDSVFATNGLATFNLSSDDESAFDMVIEPNGKITISGWTLLNGSDYDNFLARYNSNGTLDNTFGTNGSVYYDINTKDNNVFGLVQQADGKYLVCGGAYTTTSFGIPNGVWVARYNVNGTYDSTFNSIGYIITTITVNEACTANDIILQADGKIVIAGEHSYNASNNTGLVICRYNNSLNVVPQIILNTPNGGENWLIGSTQAITWANAQTPNVKLEFTTDVGTWNTIVASTPASSSSYNWVVPNTPSNFCKVRVSEVSGTGIDSSNNIFNIDFPTSNTETTLNNNILVYPNPVKDILYITSQTEPIHEITIYNNFGAVVKSIKVNKGNSANVDISDLANGCYNIEINKGNPIFNKIIIKE
jgi:uncharacterized delta-60 repeat protein